MWAVDEPVDEGGGDHGGDDDRATSVATRDQGEEQIRGLTLEGQIADLVDDQEAVALQSSQLGVQRVAVLGLLEPVDPLLGGCERDAVPGLAGLDRQRDRQLRLAGAGRVGVELLMLLIRCRSACGSSGRRASFAVSSSRSWAGGPGTGS